MKKGFTLIELLGVIILLAVIALIAYPLIDNVIKDSRERAYATTVKGIEDAAKIYVTKNVSDYSTTKQQLSLDELKAAGLLNDEDVVNPIDNSILSGCVLYNWSNSKNQYEYEYNSDCIVSTPESCFTYSNNAIESYEINYATCREFLNSTGWGYGEENADLFCSGKTMSEGYSFDYLIHEGYPIEVLISNGIIYNVKYGLEITGYEASCGVDVVLPKSINGNDIVSIGNGAFCTKSYMALGNSNDNDYIFKTKNNSATENYLKQIEADNFCRSGEINSIDMSYANSLKSIKTGAFYYNKLTSVDFPSSLKYIGPISFDYNLLSKINLPESIEYIGYYAFASNYLSGTLDLSNLTNLKYLTGFDGNNLNNVILPNNLLEIGEDAFAYNQLSTITIPDSVEYISGEAFAYNQLSTITIPSNVKHIYYEAFYNNNITSVNINTNDVYISSTAFSNNPWYENNTDEFMIAGGSLIKYNGLSKNVTIPSNVKYIGDKVFYGIQLTNVTIPSGVKEIGYSTFGNNALTSINIPEGMESIGDSAFMGNQLTSVTIPSSVSEIYYRAFYKSSTSNPNLTQIINQTNRAFQWGSIINGKSDAAYYFATGTVVNSTGNVNITAQ